MAIEPVVVKVDGFHIFVEQHHISDAFDTVILVNGALSTTRSFGQTVKYLRQHFNIILYDLPYAGQSRDLNPRAPIVTKNEEVDILTALIDHFKVAYIVSISWGGVAALLALARSPKSVKRAAICSFSPIINTAMKNYIANLSGFLEAGDPCAAAELVNHTVGQHLPRILKRFNYGYLTSLNVDQHSQVTFHINQMMSLDAEVYLRRLTAIQVPLLFINGELDQYTPQTDIRALSQYIRSSRFITIPNAGHFLDLESRDARDRVQHAMCNFFLEDAVAVGTHAIMHDFTFAK